MRRGDARNYAGFILSMIIEAKKRPREGQTQVPDWREPPVVNIGEAADWVAHKSGLPRNTVLRVLEAETDYAEMETMRLDGQLRAEVIALETQIRLDAVALVLDWELEYLVHRGIAWDAPGEESEEDEEEE